MPYRLVLADKVSEVYLHRGCRRDLIERLRADVRRFVVISDTAVAEALRDSLDLDVPWLVVPKGEASKDFKTAYGLWEDLSQYRVDRGTAVLAVGGGVVGDLAGFVAATYLRGLPFYNMPASLLAMVDASIGGKTGIDLPAGKNLVGAFYPAQAVAIDPELLETLPAAEWSSGMAEVIKHGILAGDELWRVLERLEPAHLHDGESCQHLVREAVKVKLDIVSSDPFERTGLRATLNLGHTIGHALEWSSEFRLRHGEAVALGLLAAVRLARRLGCLDEDFEEALTLLLARWSLPVCLPNPESPHWTWSRLQQGLSLDKKARDGSWHFVLPVCLGKVEIRCVEQVGEVEAVIESLKRAPQVLGA